MRHIALSCGVRSLHTPSTRVGGGGSAPAVSHLVIDSFYWGAYRQFFRFRTVTTLRRLEGGTIDIDAACHSGARFVTHIPHRVDLTVDVAGHIFDDALDATP